MKTKASKAKTPTVREHTRYSVRTKLPDGKIKEIGVGSVLEELIAQAKGYHDKTGSDVWVWNIRDGSTLFAINGALAEKAGAQ